MRLTKNDEKSIRCYADTFGAPDFVQFGRNVVDILAAYYSPVALLQATFVLVDKGVLPLRQAVKLTAGSPKTPPANDVASVRMTFAHASR